MSHIAWFSVLLIVASLQASPSRAAALDWAVPVPAGETLLPEGRTKTGQSSDKPLTTTREMSRTFWLINSIGIDQASVPQKTSRIMPTSCRVRWSPTR